MTAGSKGGVPPLGGLGSGRPQREGGRERKGKVMALVVVLFGEGDGF